MSHAAGDALIDHLQVRRENNGGRLEFRLGIEFRALGAQVLPEEQLSARYVRLQVASPPPQRVDGTPWEAGLLMYDRSDDDKWIDFDPHAWQEERPAVFAVEGVSPLGLPAPGTLCFDQWIAVPVVHEQAPRTIVAITARFDTATVGDNHFVSVDYPRPVVEGERPDSVAVTYSVERSLPLTGNVGDWVAISLSQFYPPERASAEYIVAVSPEPPADDAGAA